MSERRVVITGMGVLTPLGCELETFWQNLLAGKSGIAPVTRFDTTPFDCKIGGEIKDFKAEEFMPIKETRRTDRFVQYAIGAAKKAVVDSGIDMSTADVNRVGVLIGSGIGGMETIEDQVCILLKKGPGRVSPFMIPMPNLSHRSAGRMPHRRSGRCLLALPCRPGGADRRLEDLPQVDQLL